MTTNRKKTMTDEIGNIMKRLGLVVATPTRAEIEAAKAEIRRKIREEKRK